MPLSKPTPRTQRYNRKVECNGYLRDDGLWDIEACMKDVRSLSFPCLDKDGEMKAGETFHEFWVRLTIDKDFLIHDIEVSVDCSPAELCAGVVPAFQALKGLKITRGFKRELKNRIMGVTGCTHLYELIWYMGGVAFQTLSEVRHKQTEEEKSQPNPLINACYGMSSDREVVKRNWSEHYTGTK
ncbi:MAG: DUF2889 domain-containing protein [Alphaproteobacteria bacterium]|nr:DUF2889 domain-containing protein [Alphaproteobacteria bacterium]